MAELATTLSVSEADRLNQAEGIVRAYCGWHIAPSRTETLRLRGWCDRVIVLPSLHVTAVTSVTLNGSVLDPAAYDCTEAGTLTVGYSDGRRWYDDLEVVFVHGYDAPPAEVTGAVQAIAQAGIDNPKRLTSWTRGPFGESYAAGVDMTPLDPYKRPPSP